MHSPFTRILCTSIIGLAALSTIAPLSHANQTNKALLHTYANIAKQTYHQALVDAQQLQQSIHTFTQAPTTETLEATQQAWLVSRESYGVSEIFRLAEGPIDAAGGWVSEAYGAPEGQLNAWPLDENMIDYTQASNGQISSGNIVDTAGLFNPGGASVDVTNITPKALAALNENGGDANVATGYHAIEFLLWGQDQDYSNFVADTVSHGALVAGQRPLTDFTSDNLAPRRLDYLQAAAQLLINDLAQVAQAWTKRTSYSSCEVDATGCYRSALLGELSGVDADKNMDSKVALRNIIAGMGVFIKSELANERIAVAVLTPSEEDEHSCFSDNTHRDIDRNYQGFINVLKGEFNGQAQGSNMYDLASPATQAQLDQLISAIDTRVAQVNHLAENTMHFDYQIADVKQAGEIRRMKNDMRKLGDTMTSVAKDINISLSVDDVTDADETQL